MTRPQRRDLLVAIATLQDLVGDALSWLDADTTPDAKARVRASLKAAQGLCLDTLEHDPPRRGSALAELRRDAETSLRRSRNGR